MDLRTNIEILEDLIALQGLINAGKIKTTETLVITSTPAKPKSKPKPQRAKIRDGPFKRKPTDKSKRNQEYRANISSSENPEWMATDPILLEQEIGMDYESFNILHEQLKPFLVKYCHRRPIETNLRLYLTLYYLAQGNSSPNILEKFPVGRETARSIIFDTCDAIWNELQEFYISATNEENWNQISEKYLTSLGLPNCIGSIDGKFIKVMDPKKKHKNKNLENAVLLAVCDADSVFTLVDIDFTGSQYANDVLYNTSLGKKIIDNELNLPPERKLADTDLTIPFYLVAGETFPLYCNIMKPYAYNNDECLKYFNIQISNAIVPIDTAFNLLTSKWKILQKVISMKSENAKKIILATIILHNFLQLNNKNHIMDAAEYSVPSVFGEEFTETTATLQAVNVRNKLCEYLTNHHEHNPVITYHMEDFHTFNKN